MKYKIGKKNRGVRKKIVTGFLVVVMIFGGYLMLLIQSPNIPFVKAADVASDFMLSTESVDSLIIPRLNARVPFYTGDQSALQKGAWHRYPERGDPVKGGNFILSAHRFNLGLTPQGTKQKSSFYHIDELHQNDDIYVVFKGKKYHYVVSRVYDVSRSAVEIEAPSTTAKLTLYSCSMQGERAGRLVVEAKPV